MLKYTAVDSYGNVVLRSVAWAMLPPATGRLCHALCLQQLMHNPPAAVSLAEHAAACPAQSHDKVSSRKARTAMQPCQHEHMV